MCRSERWDRAAPDPDPTDDLGYRIADWETYRVRYSDGEKFVMVPADEDAFESEAYIVASADLVADMVDHC